MTTIVEELQKVGIPTELGDKIVAELFGVQKTYRWAQWHKLFPFDDWDAMAAIKEELSDHEAKLRAMLTPAQFQTVYFFFTMGPHACKTSLVMATTQIRASVNPYFV